MKNAFQILSVLFMVSLCGCQEIRQELELDFNLGINTPSRTRAKLAGLRTVAPGDSAAGVVAKAGHPLETRNVESYEVWEWRYIFRFPGGWAVFRDGEVVETGWADHPDPDRRKSDLWLSKAERLMGGPAGKVAAQRRRAQYLELNTGLPVKIRERIANGEISAGMSAGDVVASWGEPDRKKNIQQQYGLVEQWTYGRTDVFFENGGVSVWQVPE